MTKNIRPSRDEIRRTLDKDSVIRHIVEFDPRSLLVVMYMRSSTREQRQRNNLQYRRNLLRRDLRASGIERDCRVFTEVISGTQLTGRQKLFAAIEYAHELQRDNPAKLVAVVTDARNRFIRGRHYNGQEDTDTPLPSQLEHLRSIADGVILATLLHPDTPFGDVRSYETNVPTRLGITMEKKVGRPKKIHDDHVAGWKAQRRKDYLEPVRQLHRGGVSMREIERRTRIPLRTIRDWLKNL